MQLGAKVSNFKICNNSSLTLHPPPYAETKKLKSLTLDTNDAIFFYSLTCATFRRYFQKILSEDLYFRRYFQKIPSEDTFRRYFQKITSKDTFRRYLRLFAVNRTKRSLYSEEEFSTEVFVFLRFPLSYFPLLQLHNQSQISTYFYTLNLFLM